MREPVHPGRALKIEIEARGVSATKLALALRVPSGRITAILNGKRGISAETALRLGHYFGNSPQFWLNLQKNYELAVAERELGEKIRTEVIQAAWTLRVMRGLRDPMERSSPLPRQQPYHGPFRQSGSALLDFPASQTPTYRPPSLATEA